METGATNHIWDNPKRLHPIGEQDVMILRGRDRIVSFPDETLK